MRTEIYHDFYGYWAYLRNLSGGAARLAVYNPSGRPCHVKNYKTRRGARIAMGLLSDSWEQWEPSFAYLLK